MILTRENGERVEIPFGSALCGESFLGVEFTSEEINKHILNGAESRRKAGMEYVQHLLTCRMVYEKLG